MKRARTAAHERNLQRSKDSKIDYKEALEGSVGATIKQERTNSNSAIIATIVNFKE
jgi:hypothetical protein